MSYPGAIVITGCSSGIGRATALHLVQRGNTVYATARRLETIADLERAGCRTLALDVLDEESMQAAVAAVEAEHGSVGALVNNAGYAVSGAIEAVPLDAVRTEFETNVFGYVRMAQLVLPGMRGAGKGRIVNVSSVAGRVTLPGAGAYAASKYAIEAISDALRFEVRGFGVDVIVIEPGPIRTEFTASANTALERTDAGPYAAYHAAVAKADAETDESFIADRPERVARAIERALDAGRPRPRYRVTPVAHVLPKLRGALGDRAFDAFLRTQIKAPS
jgi:NAD(P)-dependent dehydrogenase (short-subunit alcohol dehydrogenase family)